MPTPQPEALASTLELLVCDINGVPRGKTIASASFEAGQLPHLPLAVLMQTIVGEYAELMDSYNPKDEDMLLQPDWASYRLSPWKDDTAQVICQAIDKNSGQAVGYDTRYVLQQVLESYANRGLQPVVAPELEFYLLEPVRNGDQELRQSPGRDGWSECGGEAFNLDALDRYQGFIDEVTTASQQAGLATDGLVHEMGPGQIELNVRHGDALRCADELFLLKRLVKACALRHGKLASFMAKPVVGIPGNGLHMHCSLSNAQGENVFALEDGGAPARLRHFIGGLQQFMPAIFALIAPNVNSYKRFVRGVSAPINLHWGYDNRTTGFRIPYGPDAAGRVESRIAGADANPYLFMAATLVCGLLGMEQQLEPTAPHEGDAYNDKADLPDNLYDALTALQASELLIDALGKEFVDVFVSVKHGELNAFSQQISPWEVSYLGSQL